MTAISKPMKKRARKKDILFPICNTLFLILVMVVTLYPVVNTVAISFNDGHDALRGGIGIVPRVFSTKAYSQMLSDKDIYQAFWISASKTVLITVLNLFWTSMIAFALSRKEYIFRKPITIILVLTMYFNAGLIPNFLLVNNVLGLGQTYWVYIIPTMFSCFNMIVIRTYIAGLPEALVESAHIDGASDIRAFFSIILPLCLPVLATVALFVAVGSWNSWFDTRLYNASKKNLHTLQYKLNAMLAATQNQSGSANQTTDALTQNSGQQVTPVTVRCAIMVISAVPIMVVYPFLQKYFVTGMALGSVKG